MEMASNDKLKDFLENVIESGGYCVGMTCLECPLQGKFGIVDYCPPVETRIEKAKRLLEDMGEVTIKITPDKVAKWLNSIPNCWFWDDDPSKAVEGVLEGVDKHDEYYHRLDGDWYKNCSLEKPVICKELTPIEAAAKFNKEGPFECEVSNNRNNWKKTEIVGVHISDCKHPFGTENNEYRHCRIKE